MRTIRLLIPLLLTAPLSAQNAAPGLEVGVDVSHWQLDHGTASADPAGRQTGTVRAAVLIPSRRPATLGLSATYAPLRGDAPGVLGFGSEFAQRVGVGGRDDMNLFVGVGAGILRLTEEEEDDGPCLPENGCIDESPELPGDWRPMLSASLGADVPIARGALMQPAIQVLKPVGSDVGERTALVRLGIGLAWRP